MPTHPHADELLAHFDPHDASLLGEDQAAAYALMRHRCPVTSSDRYGGFYTLTRHEDIVRVLADPATFSSETITIPVLPKPWPFLPIELDPPQHQKARNIVLPLVSPAHVAALEGLVRDTADELIDGFMTKPEFDLAAEFAAPLPGVVLSVLLGVPAADRAWFQDQSAIISYDDDLGKRLEALVAIAHYIESEMAARRDQPDGPDDILTRLVVAEREGTLSRHQVVGYGLFFLLAGHETTGSAIGSSLAYLATHDDDRRRLVGRPELIPVAVEEFLRWEAPVSVARTVTTDTVLGHVQLHQGDLLWIPLVAANLDESFAPDPGRVDFERTGNRHVAFGVGVHRCLGANLARMEMRVALEQLLARVPDFAPVPGAEVVRSGGNSRGVRALLVSVPAASPRA